jgi:hypothetical protein
VDPCVNPYQDLYQDPYPDLYQEPYLYLYVSVSRSRFDTVPDQVIVTYPETSSFSC